MISPQKRAEDAILIFFSDIKPFGDSQLFCQPVHLLRIWQEVSKGIEEALLLEQRRSRIAGKATARSSRKIDQPRKSPSKNSHHIWLPIFCLFYLSTD